MLDVQRSVLACKCLATVEGGASVRVKLMPKDVTGLLVVGNARLFGDSRKGGCLVNFRLQSPFTWIVVPPRA